jgi:hypothetical protein
LAPPPAARLGAAPSGRRAVGIFGLLRHADSYLRPLVLAFVAALGLGIAGRLAIHAGSDFPRAQALGRAAVALGAPWLATAWGLGALCGTRARGALAGALALALGTGAWYVVSVYANGHPAAYLPTACAWGAVALVAGALFGLAGAVWREGGRLAGAIGVAALAGPLAGEAALLGAEWSGRAAQAVLAAEVAAAFVLLFAARRRAPLLLTLALFALGALVFAGAEDAIRDGVRLAGWAGR